MKRLNTPESKARMAKSASNFRKRVNAAAIGGAIAFSVYSVLSESAHRRRIISQYEEGTGPATKSNLREFLGDNVSLGEELHEEEEDGPLREALNNFLLNHGITSADIPKLLTMVAGLKCVPCSANFERRRRRSSRVIDLPPPVELPAHLGLLTTV